MKEKNSIKGLSDKEIKVVSFLELEEKRFFSKEDVRHFFRSDTDMRKYTSSLKRKGRIVRINKNKYYLVPIQSQGGWAEHPFIVADEIFNGSEYYIGGKAAAHYWGLIDQIPTVIDVFSTKKQGSKTILGTRFRFRRVRRLGSFVRRTVAGHSFLIASKEESRKWI
jgi:predicted transcriptional regulator of viral defense system